MNLHGYSVVDFVCDLVEAVVTIVLDVVLDNI